MEDDKVIKRLKLVRDVIMEQRKGDRNWYKNPDNMRGTCGILDFIETGKINRIAIDKVRKNVRRKLELDILTDKMGGVFWLSEEYEIKDKIRENNIKEYGIDD